jgi:hypothetical protein
MAMYHGPVPPTGSGSTDNFFKPLEWNNISVPIDSISSGTITGVNASSITQVWPGNLVDYTMEHDKSWLMASGRDIHDMEVEFKKEMAVKLAEKMIADGHIIFTKQDMLAENKFRYKAYTWVGNKDFIEQRRKYG